MLVDAGWGANRNDEVLRRQGRPFRFTLLTPTWRTDEGVYLQSQLCRVGIDARIQLMDQ